MIRIIESKYLTSAVHTSGYPDTAVSDFAFVGRSNVGKSSMINTLTGRKLLAKIANKPGKTRLINFFDITCLGTRDLGLGTRGNGEWSMENGELGSANQQHLPQSLENSRQSAKFVVKENIRETSCTSMTPSPIRENSCNSMTPLPLHFTLVDLPGYGYAKVSQTEREHWKKIINDYFKNRQQLRGVIVLVDIRHSVDPKDILMINMLNSQGINFMIAATKCDKIPKNKIPTHLKNIKKDFNLTDTVLVEFSSLKKIGTEKVLNWIESQLTQEEIAYARTN
jgi:ribosome biogenesis GTP-binding protein YsxC/EngB